MLPGGGAVRGARGIRTGQRPMLPGARGAGRGGFARAGSPCYPGGRGAEGGSHGPEAHATRRGGIGFAQLKFATGPSDYFFLLLAGLGLARDADFSLIMAWAAARRAMGTR